FQLLGFDPDTATTLVFSAVGLPTGSTLDAHTGQLLWTPSPTQIGDFPVQFSLTDGELTATQAVVLRATLDPILPSVLVELTPSFPGVPLSPVIVHVAASSFAPIVSLALSVAGQSLVLD